MAATLVSLSGLQRGCGSAETGIVLESFDVSSRPEYKDFVHNYNGDVMGHATGEIMSEITITGEVAGTTGVMAVAVGTAFVPGNSINYFGQTAGGCYPDSMDVTQSRDGFKRVTCKFTRHKNVT